MACLRKCCAGEITHAQPNCEAGSNAGAIGHPTLCIRSGTAGATLVGLHPPLGTPHPEARVPLLFPHPRQEVGHFRMPLQGLYGTQFLLQRRLAEHRMKLAVAGGAEHYLWAVLASTGLGYQVMAGEAAHFPLTQLAGTAFLALGHFARF